jgi:acyl-CoA reductase-like NAD-dependent aldehyde dehydrogenase
MHERMAEFAQLTPEQRQTLRENYRRAYALPPEQRQERLQKFQELPEEKKRELARQASGKKKEPPRRATRDMELDPVAAPPGAPTR